MAPRLLPGASRARRGETATLLLRALGASTLQPIPTEPSQKEPRTNRFCGDHYCPVRETLDFQVIGLIRPVKTGDVIIVIP